jgi:hypothetical protein
MNVELTIVNGSTLYYPCVKDGITWETERKGTPGILKFTVIKTDNLSFVEGNAVRLIVDGKGVFFGFIFKKKRDKQHHIEVTAYDQLRYFKNKETYVYKNKRADQVIMMMARDFSLNVGSLDNTGYVIEQKVEDNKTLFDIAQNALDDTLLNRKRMYVLYDDFGKLMLQNIENMKTNLLIDADTGENFSYESSIDDQTYNQIKIVYENEKTGKRDVYTLKDNNNINRWGVLQYYDKVSSDIGVNEKIYSLLELYNQKTRHLKITNAFGDLRIRAGSSVVVMLDLGDITVQSFMMCEKVKHTFNNDHHTMDLTLRGGTFIS